MYMGRVHVGNMSMYVHVKVGNQVSVNHTQDLLQILETSCRSEAHQPLINSRRDGRAPAQSAGALGKAALFPVHKFVGARQVRPAPLYWGLDLERVALAGPIPKPHTP